MSKLTKSDVQFMIDFYVSINNHLYSHLLYVIIIIIIIIIIYLDCYECW